MALFGTSHELGTDEGKQASKQKAEPDYDDARRTPRAAAPTARHTL